MLVARRVVLILSLAGVMIPGGDASASVASGAGHAAEDSVVHTAAEERALGSRTSAATAGDAATAAAAVAAGAGDAGEWGPVVNWPVVGVHVALMPNGKVLAYDSVGDHATETYPNQTTSRATVWDPSSGSQTPVNVNTGFNIFCSGLAHLPDGRLYVAGGNKDQQLHGIVQTHLFDPATNSWSTGTNMARGRWYPTVTPLNNGEMLITSGYDTSDNVATPEVRQTDGSLRQLTSGVLAQPLYPWMDVGPDGRAFNSGPEPTLRALNASGTGAWQTYGERDTINRTYGSHVLYDVGKLLIAGGGPSSKDARVIDINGATPQVTQTSSMAFGRRQHNLTVLADGSVLATGGNSSGTDLVDLDNGVYNAEQWNPATGTWRTLAAEQVTRQYHSTALLLPDGRVLSSGGGVCGKCDSVGYLAKNGQVFSPPYLFNADGSPATRPAIAAAPAGAPYNYPLQVTTPDAASISKVALIRLGAVTHSDNMEQRYVPLAFTKTAGSVTATGPANANIAPPGVYMLTITNAAGVPSISRMITVGTPPPGNSPPAVTVTAPANGQSFTAPASVALSATASDTDGSVTTVAFYNGATKLGEDTTAPYTYTWTGVDQGTYAITARASDDRGAATTSAPVSITVATAGSGGSVGLVGAWGFGEASGATVIDASGKGNTGTITNATRTTTGRFGSALAFNGTNALVTVPDANSLDLTTRGTLEAWINPTTNGGWRTAILKERPYGLAYALYANSSSNLPNGELTTATTEEGANGITALPLNTWSHLAMTFDGTTQRLFLNATQIAARPFSGTVNTTTGALRFGGNNIWGEWFAGRLDELRIYNRALTTTELQTDMTTPVDTGAPPPPPPTPVLAATPSSLSFAATQGAANPAAQTVNVTNTGGGSLSYTTSDDQPWLTVTPTTGTAPAALSVSASTTGLAPGSYTGTITITANGATGSPKTITATLTVTAPATPVLAAAPSSLSFAATQGAANPAAQTVNVTNTGGGSLSYTTSDDQPWLTVTPTTGTAPAALTVSTTTTGLAPGSYTGTITITANGATGSPKTITATLTVTAASGGGAAGLVGAWGFGEASGATVIDASGKGNTGTITNATRTTTGRFGSALAFNGTNALVTVPDANSLDLTTRGTLEAWINPTTNGGWRTAILKERPYGLAYALYANSSSNLPNGELTTATTEEGANGITALPLNTWSHLAMTFDGTTQRLFLNATQIAARPFSGTVNTTTGALRFGGNNIWGEWFAGRLDELRIYNRALTTTELQTDMTTPVG